MPLSPQIKKIFTVLFAANILLLLGYIIVSKIYSSPAEEDKIELGFSEVNTRFKRALHGFNMSDDWIVKQKGNDSAVRYKVSVPKDLPIPLLVREIGNSFDTLEAELSSKELKIRGATELKIISNGKVKLTALFDYNDKINRRSAEIGFIISAPDLTDEIKNLLIKTPQKFLLLVIPSRESAEFVKQLKESGKEYALLLNDDTDDLDFKLNPNYSKERLKLSKNAMLTTFRDAVCYFYDPKSNLYSSLAFEYERAELMARKIMLLDISKIPVLEGDNYKEEMKKMLYSFNQDEKKLVLISSEDYFNALQEITLFWKKGYKFINPSIILSGPKEIIP